MGFCEVGFIDTTLGAGSVEEHPFDVALLEKQALKYVQLEGLLC